MPAMQPISYHAAVNQIVQDVFDLMLGYGVEPSSSIPDADCAEMVTASVFFSGSWEGATLLECPQSVASTLSSHLLGLPESGNTDEQTKDAVGEIVNMIGGNLKAMLPPGVVLSPPSITSGSAYERISFVLRSKETFGFTCEGGPFWLTLVKDVASDSAS